jgi:tetrahydromethanopterin S-methyltransferase subunit E
MGSLVGVVVAGVVAAALAVGTAFGIVASQSATPDPVDKPLVVYGDR